MSSKTSTRAPEDLWRGCRQSLRKLLETPKLKEDWLARLVTRKERSEDFVKALQRGPDDIKVVIQFTEV